MVKEQDTSKILQLAQDLDNDLEKKEIDKVITYFSKDCEIELLGLKLKNYSGLKKWLKWFFELIPTIKFEPIVIMVEGNSFFEEFIIHITIEDNKKVSVKVAEVLEYEDYKVKSLRLYLDRLEFAEVAISGFLSKKIVKLIKKKSLRGLL